MYDYWCVPLIPLTFRTSLSCLLKILFSSLLMMTTKTTTLKRDARELMTAIYFLTLSDPCISISILIPWNGERKWIFNFKEHLARVSTHIWWCWLDYCSESSERELLLLPLSSHKNESKKAKSIKWQRNGNYVYDNVVIHIKEKC